MRQTFNGQQLKFRRLNQTPKFREKDESIAPQSTTDIAVV
jgi:hypothetical protein